MLRLKFLNGDTAKQGFKVKWFALKNKNKKEMEIITMQRMNAHDLPYKEEEQKNEKYIIKYSRVPSRRT